jgi:hypothetical protein
MSPELRAALRLVVESYPAGSIAPMLREHALELLEGTPTPGETTGLPPADLTVKELAARLSRKASTCRGWCERGLIPGAYRWGGSREWQVPMAGVLQFEAQQRSGVAQKRMQLTPRRQGKVADLGAWRRSVAGNHHQLRGDRGP